MPTFTTHKIPQRIVRIQEVCDSCGGLDSFRVRYPYRDGVYVQCKACGRWGFRITLSADRKIVTKSGEKNENKKS